LVERGQEAGLGLNLALLLFDGGEYFHNCLSK